MDSDDTSKSVECPACAWLHYINLASGKGLGQRKPALVGDLFWPADPHHRDSLCLWPDDAPEPTSPPADLILDGPHISHLPMPSCGGEELENFPILASWREAKGNGLSRGQVRPSWGTCSMGGWHVGIIRQSAVA